MRIVLVSNNWANRRGFLAEHGLSLLIGWKRKRLLFDTGQGLVLPENLALLKRSVREIDAVALSHGHYDHGGGLEWLASELEGKTPPLYIHPDAKLPRYCRDNGSLRRIDFHNGGKPLAGWGQIRETTQPVEIFPGLWTTGEIPSAEEEAPSEEFLIDRGAGCVQDTFQDEQGLFAVTPKGLIVITGCAHTGVVSTVKQAMALSGEKRVRAVFGGFHLRGVSEARMKWTLEQFQKLDIGSIFPLHCTGFEAAFTLREYFPDRVAMPGAGETLELN